MWAADSVEVAAHLLAAGADVHVEDEVTNSVAHHVSHWLLVIFFLDFKACCSKIKQDHCGLPPPPPSKKLFKIVSARALPVDCSICIYGVIGLMEGKMTTRSIS